MTSFAFILGVVAAGHRQRRRRRGAPGARHRRLRGDARRHAVRSAADAGVLRRLPASGARARTDRDSGQPSGADEHASAAGDRRRREGRCGRDPPPAAWRSALVLAAARCSVRGTNIEPVAPTAPPAFEAAADAALASTQPGRRVVDDVRGRAHDDARRAGAEPKPRRASSHGAGEAGARQAA